MFPYNITLENFIKSHIPYILHKILVIRHLQSCLCLQNINIAPLTDMQGHGDQLKLGQVLRWYDWSSFAARRRSEQRDVSHVTWLANRMITTTVVVPKYEWSTLTWVRDVAMGAFKLVNTDDVTWVAGEWDKRW